MIGGMYSPENFDRHIPANVLGGINRSKSAQRDQQGKFLAHGQTFRPINIQHGVAGGLKRIQTAKRDMRGRFTK